MKQNFTEAVPYYRVSSGKQGRSGLGLEAQHIAVMHYIKLNGLTLGSEFKEVTSGRKQGKQPALEQALSYCLKNKALLLIAELDRLPRRVAFIATLMESRVKFVCVNYPHADPVELHMRAVFAEMEGKKISKRTKDALQAAKVRGTILGKNGREILSKQNAEAAAVFAEKMRPVIEELHKEGFKTIREKLAELNRRQIPTFRGGLNKWHFCSVQALVKKINNYIIL